AGRCFGPDPESPVSASIPHLDRRSNLRGTRRGCSAAPVARRATPLRGSSASTIGRCRRGTRRSVGDNACPHRPLKQPRPIRPAERARTSHRERAAQFHRDRASDRAFSPPNAIVLLGWPLHPAVSRNVLRKPTNFSAPACATGAQNAVAPIPVGAACPKIEPSLRGDTTAGRYVPPGLPSATPGHRALPSESRFRAARTHRDGGRSSPARAWCRNADIRPRKFAASPLPIATPDTDGNTWLTVDRFGYTL